MTIFRHLMERLNKTILVMIEALLDEPAEIRPLIDLDSPLSESQQRAAESSLCMALCEMGIIKPASPEPFSEETARRRV